jgi:hypothetical protein
MSLMTDLATYVEAQATITALIDTRFFPQIAKSAELPYTIYYRPANRRQHKSGGSTGLVTTTIRMVHFASTYTAAANLADQFRLKLDGKPRGTIGSTFLHQVRLEDENDSLEPLEFAQNEAPAFVTQEYAVTYKETVGTFS